MHAVSSLAHSVGTRLILWLVGRHGVPYVLAGTLTMAAIGAAAATMPPTSAHSQSSTAQTTGNVTVGPYDGHHCDGDGF